jgi:hypothetical protein
MVSDCGPEAARSRVSDVFAEEHPLWGYTRMRGALKNLGYRVGHRPSLGHPHMRPEHTDSISAVKASVCLLRFSQEGHGTRSGKAAAVAEQR